MMYGPEKSDSVIVAAKPANKAVQTAVEQSAGEATAAEPVEPRAETKGNVDQQSTCRAQSRRVALLFNPETSAGGGSDFVRLLEEGARAFSVQSTAGPVHEPGDIERTIEAFARGPNGGLLVLPDNFINAHRELIVALAERYRLPAIYPFRFFASVGGLLSYGVDVIDMYRGAASYIDRILKGAKPGDLPVQQPMKFDLVINLKTAKALGLTIPNALLIQATELIE